MKQRSLSRRAVLQAAGAAVSLPFLDAMVPAFASETASAPPKRMLAICTNMGMIPRYWFPKGEGRDYTPSDYLKILEPYRDEFTVFSGVSHPHVDGGHHAEISFLTAAPHPGSNGFRNSISLDQYAAERIGIRTRIPYLALQVGPESKVGISWTASGVMIPPTKSAAATYKQMFVGGSAAEQAEQVHRLRLGQSILDTVAAEAKSLGRTLGPADRRKVDQYFESVREAEQRLEKAEAWVAKPKPSTDSPMPEDINDPRELIPKTSMMYEMAKLALESDSTRIITIHIDENHNPKVNLPGVNDGHHILTHSIWDDEKSKELKTIESEQTRVFGDLLGSLRGVAESGQSLLDNSMVLYGTNLGNGASHDTKNMPILLAGGGFRHGQHLAFDEDNNYPLPNLYVSMLQQLGIETDKFATATGTFRGLEAL